MAYDRITITIPHDLVEELAARSENASGAIQASLSRYSEILRWGRADLRDLLSDAETSLILDALNGTLWPEMTSVSFIPHEVADAIRLDQLDKKWQVDGKALIEKLSTLSYAQKCAVADATERWWLRVGKGENPEVSEALK